MSTPPPSDDSSVYRHLISLPQKLYREAEEAGHADGLSGVVRDALIEYFQRREQIPADKMLAFEALRLLESFLREPDPSQ